MLAIFFSAYQNNDINEFERIVKTNRCKLLCLLTMLIMSVDYLLKFFKP